MRLSVELAVRTNRAEVWATMCTVGGVNREVSPFVRMTDPTNGARFDADQWRDPQTVWQLLFGVIPVDRHRIELVALPDERGFRESSSTWMHRVWRHERTLLDDPGGCIVHDDVEVEPRLRLLAPIVGWAVSQMFRRRYRYLHRKFG